jgi:hypothetical protein
MTTHRSSVGRVPTHGAAPAGRNLRSLANPSQFKAPSGAWAFDGSKTYKDFAPLGLLAVDSAGVGVISTPLRKPSPPAPLPSDGRGWRHLVAEGRRQNAEGGSPNGEAGAARGHYGKPKLLNPERGTRSTGNLSNAECPSSVAAVLRRVEGNEGDAVEESPTGATGMVARSHKQLGCNGLRNS